MCRQCALRWHDVHKATDYKDDLLGVILSWTVCSCSLFTSFVVLGVVAEIIADYPRGTELDRPVRSMEFTRFRCCWDHT